MRRRGRMGSKAAVAAAKRAGAGAALAIAMTAGVATAAGAPADAWGQETTLHEEDLPPADPGVAAPPHEGWDERRETHTVTIEEHEDKGGAAGAVEGSMDKAGNETRGGLERAGAATGKALDKVITKTGEGVGYVIDKTGDGLKSAGEALSGEGH
ncbi:MAG TPA: hypothetical protein VFD92_15970 [Candidatus Binatia bacterium]|nr:hypothetical protein [Candidatus Binatia bacterium]